MTMADIEVQYKNNTIKTQTGSGTVTLHTEGKYMEDDVDIVYTAPSGGGGAVTVASGTFTGGGSYAFNVNVGKKMPMRDYAFYFWADGEDDYAYETHYKPVLGGMLVLGELCEVVYESNQAGQYDRYQYKVKKSYVVDNNGTDTTVSNVWGQIGSQSTIRNGGFGSSINFQATVASNHVRKYSDHWSVYMTQGNANYQYPTTITYNWKIIYFGSNPGTDIVEIA